MMDDSSKDSDEDLLLEAWDAEDDTDPVAGASDEPDDAPADADPAPDASDDPTAEADEPDASPASAEAAAEAPAQGESATEQPNVAGFTPPPGGEPFTFAVDGRQIPLEGATVHGDFIVIPRQAWDSTLRPSYLADRGVWRKKEAEFHRQLEAKDAERSDKELKAQGVVEWLDGFLAAPIEEKAKWLDEFELNRPVLEAQLKARVAEEQLKALQERETAQRTQEEEATRELTEMQHLGDTLERYLADDAFKVLAPHAVELAREIWDRDRSRLFTEADQDYPEHGVRKGERVFRYDVFGALLQREVQKAARGQDKVAALGKVAQANAASIGKPKPKAPPKAQPPASKKPVTTVQAKPSTKDIVDDDDWDDIWDD